MEKLLRILNENRSVALATVDSGKPRVRPFEFQFEQDGQLVFCTANNKEVYRQLQAVPWVEFTVTTKEYLTLRVRGKVDFRDDRGAKQKILASNDLIRSIYQSADNPLFEVFFVAHGEAVLSDFSGTPPATICF